MRRALISSCVFIAACGGGDVVPGDPIDVLPGETRDAGFAPDAPPEILSFEATPPRVLEDSIVVLSWRTARAAEVRVLLGARVIASFVGALVAGGSVQVPVPAGATVVLEATNVLGSARRELSLEVVPQPQVVELRVEPEVYFGVSTTATITWSTLGCVYTILQVGGREIDVFPGTPSGSFAFETQMSGRIVLTGVSDLMVGTAAAEVVLARAAVEVEDNGELRYANDLSYAGAAAGELSASDDVDFFVERSSGASIAVWIDDGAGGCTAGTELALMRYPDVLLGRAAGACAAIDPERHAFARDLEPGAIFIRVSSPSGEVGPYAIHARRR